MALVAATAVFCLFFRVERAVSGPVVDLSGLPQEVGPWRMLAEKAQPSDFESRFLNNVLYRSYQRPDGGSITLAVAYGADQRQNFSIHVPEGCYRAAGFDVTTLGLSSLVDPALPMKQLHVRKDNDAEALQYWIVLNGAVVTGHFERKLKQFYYSLLGARAGGTLVRVTSPTNGRDITRDYELQKDFIGNLYKSVTPEQRRLLFGNETI
jgi:EpsI family protein